MPTSALTQLRRLSRLPFDGLQGYFLANQTIYSNRFACHRFSKLLVAAMCQLQASKTRTRSGSFRTESRIVRVNCELNYNQKAVKEKARNGETERRERRGEREREKERERERLVDPATAGYSADQPSKSQFRASSSSSSPRDCRPFQARLLGLAYQSLRAAIE